MTNTALPAWVEDFRRQMPVTRNWIYLDHAAVSPLPEPSKKAMVDWCQDQADHGDAHWPRWNAIVHGLRKQFADWLHADPAGVALVRNTTEGITLVAEGFPWQPGDNVVYLQADFPSNRLPWEALAGRGVELRPVAAVNDTVRLQDILSQCDHRTRIVTVSWVDYASGQRLDIDALAHAVHARGSLLFVDAIQGLGVVPLNLGQTPVDFLAADGHKWLMGPEGAGLLYIRPERLPQLRPMGLGWNSVEQTGDYARTSFTLKTTAGRYEGGTYNTAGMVGLAESVRLLQSLNPQDIQARVTLLVNALEARLQSLGARVRGPYPARAGIVSFGWPGHDPLAIRKACLQAKIVLSCRAGMLRASPHAYNTVEEIERVAETLAAAVHG